MLFVHACNHTETVPGNSTASHLEVALTGTACPVQLILQPDKIISFGTCNTGTITTKDIQVCGAVIHTKVYTHANSNYIICVMLTYTVQCVMYGCFVHVHVYV